ncbi:hypothetical protein EDD22DRAFT_851080 [Suillus occidentalis]|nr:hypothetical protein EDD22DRAFT_851080 [Suillus occidentalis]
MAGTLPPGASRRRTVRVQPFLNHIFLTLIHLLAFASGSSPMPSVSWAPFQRHHVSSFQGFNVMISDGVSSLTRSSTLTCKEAPASSESIASSTGTFDEAHRVKNPKLKITLAHDLKTATWNMEAWTILDWINPGRLGTSKQWKGYVVRSLMIGQSTSVTEEARIKALYCGEVGRTRYPT